MQAQSASDSLSMPSRQLIFIFALVCGVVVANLYYAQPLVGLISQELGLDIGKAGLIVTATQIGYATGLLLIVPLFDLKEGRKLVLTLMGLSAVAVLIEGSVEHASTFLMAAFLAGMCSVSAAVLVPFMASLTPEAHRGLVVGKVMSGLMLGIMLARPVASFITEISSWHAVFYLSAFIMILLMGVLYRTLPRREPPSNMPYWVLLKSIIGLMLTTPVLRRRSIYHACLFAAFSLFWTVTPLYLSQAPFHLSHSGIALFALAGVAGAVGTPLAGYLADKGWVRISTGCAMLAVAVSFLIARMADSDSAFLLGILVFAAILLDFGVAVNLTLGQRVIFSLNPEYRGRFNSVYMVIFFLGGALGSWIGTISYGRGGWESSAWVGFCFPILALLYFAAERKRNH